MIMTMTTMVMMIKNGGNRDNDYYDANDNYDDDNNGDDDDNDGDDD